MSHRVNFKVYRLGKTIKWNFSAPLTNIQNIMRLNYIMNHWVKRALVDCNIKIFKFFYAISSDFPFIKVIGYRKLYVKSKKIFSNFNFTIKSSQLLDSDNLFAISSGRFSTKLNFYRQREKNRKLITVKETSKQHKASYKTVLLPLISGNNSPAFMLNFFLLEAKSADSSSNLSIFGNYAFDHNFLFNTFAVFSLLGSANSSNFNQSPSRLFFKSLLESISHISIIFKNLLKVESSSWLKFFTFYTHLFLSTHNLTKNESVNFKLNSSMDVNHFFLLKKSFFVIKLVLKNYPQSIFLNNGLNGLKSKKTDTATFFLKTSFLLNILRFYFFVVNNKKFDTQFCGLNETRNKFRNRPSYFLFLKLKLALVAFKSICDFNNYFCVPRNFSNKFFVNIINFKNKILFKWRVLIAEIFEFWVDKGLSVDYIKIKFDKVQSAALLAAQTVVFLSNDTNIKYIPVSSFFFRSSDWWKSRFFLSNNFDYDWLFYFILSYNARNTFALNYFLSNFILYFSNSFINNYFQKWSSFFLNDNLSIASFNVLNLELGNKRRKRKYVRPIKVFADIDKALSVRIPSSYVDLLKTSLKSSSVFSFHNYERNLEIERRNLFLNNRPHVFFRKLIDNLLFLINKAENEKANFSVLIESGAPLVDTIKSLTYKFLYNLKKISRNTNVDDNFFYAIRILKLFENSLTFFRASQRSPAIKNTFFKKLFFKAGIFSFLRDKTFNLKVHQLKLRFLEKHNFFFDYLFLKPLQHFFVTSENVTSFVSAAEFLRANNVIYLQNKRQSSLAVIQTIFSYVNPAIAPHGVLKYNKNELNHDFKNSNLASFPSFSFFDFLSFDFLCNTLLKTSIKFNLNFFSIFKSNIVFSALKKIQPRVSFMTLYLTFYFVNHYAYTRKFISGDTGIINFFHNFSTQIASHKNKNHNFLNDSGETAVSQNKLKIFNLIEKNRPYMKLTNSVNDFFLESFYLLNITSAFFKVFGISYEVIFYPIYRVFQDNSRFQFLISQAGDFLRAYVSRNPYVLYWLNEFIVLFYASIATKSTKALSQFMAERFKKEYYWNQPAAFMFSVIRSVWLWEFGISGMRIGFHGKFGGQERAYRLYKTWGANPCLRNGLLTGSHSSSRCHSKYGITDIHIWLVYY